MMALTKGQTFSPDIWIWLLYITTLVVFTSDASDHQPRSHPDPWYQRRSDPDSRYQRRSHPDPRFLSPSVNVTVRVGSRAVLPCSVQFLGTKQVSWNRYGEDHFLTIGDLTWVRDPNITVDHELQRNDVSRWDLVFEYALPRHSGVYTCQVIAKTKYTKKVQLNVVDPPEVAPAVSISGKEYVEMGEPIRLVCNATGGPQIAEDVDWFKDGDIVVPGQYRKVIITKYRSLEDHALVSELIIDRSRGDDTGTYICRSSHKEIDSMEVTVLVANSSNVKRGSGSLNTTKNLPSQAMAVTHIALTIHSFIVISFTFSAAFWVWLFT